jgi:hypothetical protein
MILSASTIAYDACGANANTNWSLFINMSIVAAGTSVPHCITLPTRLFAHVFTMNANKGVRLV